MTSIEHEIAPARQAVPDDPLPFIHGASCTAERTTGSADTGAAARRLAVADGGPDDAANDSGCPGTGDHLAPRLDLIGKGVTVRHIDGQGIGIHTLGIDDRTMPGKFLYLATLRQHQQQAGCQNEPFHGMTPVAGLVRNKRQTAKCVDRLMP